MIPSANAPTAITIEGSIRRADGTVEELGAIAYSHRSRLRTILGQRKVRGSSITRALLGRHPKIEKGHR